MGHLLIDWFLSAVALMVVTKVLPGIEVDSFGSAMIAALAIGIANVTVGAILKFFLLPFAILTLGLVYLGVNGLMLKLASDFVPGFRVNGCATAIVGSVLMSIVSYLLTRVVGF
jgi:putative membrane protein